MLRTVNPQKFDFVLFDAVSYTHLDVYKRQDPGRENMFDVIRQFYVLVDSHFKEKKHYNDELEIPVDKISDTLKVSGRHISVAVSYTHLDVYKRQALKWGTSCMSRCEHFKRELWPTYMAMI